jgi:hypothetical protein
MSGNWKEWERELLDRERQWERTEEEGSIWWSILGAAILVACASMVIAAMWECFR